jgi:hypothetical protein
MVDPNDPSESEALNYDLQTAADVQAKLIPKEVPKVPGYDLAAFYRPCKQISGDYFDFVKLDDKRVGMLIADVSGKGLSAGFIMAQVRTYMHNNLQVLGAPYLTAVSLNDYLRKTIPHGMFVTMFYFVLHVPSGQIACVNCGHNPLIWYQSLTNEVKMIGQQGMALGIASKAIFQESMHEVKVHLAQDDVVLQYTDGVSEAMDAQSNEFSIEKTAELVRQYGKLSCNEMLESIVRDVYAFAGSTQLQDDATLIALKKVAAAVSAPSSDKVPVDKLITVADASKKTGVPIDMIREAIRSGQIRSQFVENVWDHMVPEGDVVRLAQNMGEKIATKPRVLMVATHSNFSDIITLELKRNQKIDARFAGVSPDAVRAAQQFDPSIVLFELAEFNPKIGQILSDLKKACPVAEFMIYMDNPTFATKNPDIANVLRVLNAKHVFDKAKGSRPVLMLLASKIAAG